MKKSSQRKSEFSKQATEEQAEKMSTTKSDFVKAKQKKEGKSVSRCREFDTRYVYIQYKCMVHGNNRFSSLQHLFLVFQSSSFECSTVLLWRISKCTCVSIAYDSCRASSFLYVTTYTSFLACGICRRSYFDLFICFLHFSII